MLYSVDRITEETAVLVDEETNLLEVALYRLPQGTKEGDVLLRDDNGMFYYSAEKTQEKRDKIQQMLDELLKKP